MMQIPVAEGSASSLTGVMKTVASFVHGDDGFGNTNQKIVEGRKFDKSAAEFIADTVSRDPGNVSILALGPLTNIAMAFQVGPEVARNVEELIILGGAFDVEGNVNPAAEANILGDPEAADFVFGQTARIRLVGLDVTHQCRVPVAALEKLKGSTGKFGPFLFQALQFYLKYHRDAYGIEAIFAHDPTAFIAALRPELFSWRDGAVRVIPDGFAKGKTLQDPGRKKWNTANGWTGRPKLKVAVDVAVEEVIQLMLDRMSK